MSRFSVFYNGCKVDLVAAHYSQGLKLQSEFRSQRLAVSLWFDLDTESGDISRSWDVIMKRNLTRSATG